MTVAVRRRWCRRVDGGRRDSVRRSPNKRSQQSQLRRLVWPAAAGDRGALNRTPVAPPWRHDRSLEKAAKKRGRPFWASSDERVEYEADPPPAPPRFDSPSTHPP